MWNYELFWFFVSIMSTPSWLKTFAARKKPKLDDPAAAVAGSGGGTTPTVDVSAVNDYMAEELLQVNARFHDANAL